MRDLEERLRRCVAEQAGALLHARPERRQPAETGSSTYGYVNAVSTSHDAPSPRKRRGGVMPIALERVVDDAAWRQAGDERGSADERRHTSGRTNTTRHIRRNGRSVRTVSQASPVPMTAAEPDTSTASWIVRHSGAGISANASESDVFKRTVRHSTNAAGTAKMAPISSPTRRSIANTDRSVRCGTSPATGLARPGSVAVTSRLRPPVSLRGRRRRSSRGCCRARPRVRRNRCCRRR